jgi:hypothetical protein
MPLLLKGSCRCGAVTFEIQSHTPAPYQLCYCSICRKDDERPHCEVSTGERNFCKKCGSALWLYDPTWPDLVHPFASAVDSDLPKPPQKTHLMLKYKANWVEPNVAKGDLEFDLYPEESIADWHRRNKMWVD